MQALDIVTVDSRPALDAHEAAWNELSTTSSQRAPMLTYAWISSYLDHRVRPGERWRVYLAYQDRRLVGVLPLLVSPRRLWRLPYRVARAPYDEHTISVSPLVADDCADAALTSLLRAAGAEAGAGALHLEFLRVPQHAPLLAFLDERPLAVPHLRRFRSHGAYLPAPADFDAYRRGLSRNLRSNLNKAKNKLAALDQVRWRFLAGADADERDLAAFMTVEGSGWKGRAGTAINRSPALIEFYTTLTRRLGRAGLLEWHFLEAAGEPLAANLAVRLGDRLLLWKLGYNDAYRACSPGSLLMEELVRRVCERGEVGEIDMMTDWEWYDRWQMQRRDCFDVFVYPRRPLALSGYAARRLYVRARRSPALDGALTRLRELAARHR
ncbi:GNAT family N-acetyltransferase [Haliangium sp.]|uniref:GNAT family N-acetyltransferase n=1 Tax=Haliangium sp. TaxID=2663208 RepID=UPI003D0BB903